MYELYFAPGASSNSNRLERPQNKQIKKTAIDTIKPTDYGDELLHKTNKFQLDYFVKYFSKEIEGLMEISQHWASKMSSEYQARVQKNIVEVFLQTHGPCEWARSIFEKYRQQNKNLTQVQFEKEMDEKMKHYTLPIN